MAVQRFINLPVKDLAKSKEFFTKLGFSFKPEYTDDKTACIIIKDGEWYAMLVTEEFYYTFIPGKDISDEKIDSRALMGVTVNSKEEADALVEKAVAAGGKDHATENEEWTYVRAFLDLDGHQWAVFYEYPDKK